MARPHTHSSFKTINEIINEEAQFQGLRETVKNYQIVAEFENIFPDLKLIASAIKVEKNILFLKVENSVWKSELNFRKNVIAEKINKHFKEPVIKSIKFL